MNYRIYQYDVWGNAEYGYEVNDVFSTNVIVELDNAANDDEIIRAALGYIGTERFEEDGDAHTLYITRERDGCPMCELRREVRV
jgi:hypothetical protein